MNKLTSLSVAVLFLAVFNVYISDIDTTKTYEASVYIEGDKANLAKVADLLIDYDKNNLELVSMSTGGFFVGSSNIRKENWEETRSVQMSTSVDTTKPILKLKFKEIRKNKSPDIKLSPNSSLYLSQIGSATLPSEGISYRIKYD